MAKQSGTHHPHEGMVGTLRMAGTSPNFPQHKADGARARMLNGNFGFVEVELVEDHGSYSKGTRLAVMKSQFRI